MEENFAKLMFERLDKFFNKLRNKYPGVTIDANMDTDGNITMFGVAVDILVTHEDKETEKVVGAIANGYISGIMDLAFALSDSIESLED